LFSEVYGATANWLDLCLNPKLAPNGDILWTEPQLPMSVLVDNLVDAYRRFYTTDRFSRLSAKLRGGEIQSVSDAYAELRQNRAASWSRLSAGEIQGVTC
jgi:hypothetical protein